MTRSASKASLELLPGQIALRLRQLVRRARAVAIARGAAHTLATFVGGMLLSITADIFVPMLVPTMALLFTVRTRIIMAVAVLLATTIVAGWTILRPIRRRYSLSAAALALEADHPELQERISTTVELMLNDDPDAFRGSPELIEVVASAADADSLRVSPRQVVRATRAERAWLAAGLLLAAVIAVGVYWPAFVHRFVAPWDDSAQFRWTEVISLTEDLETPRGEPLVIEARSVSRLRTASATLIIDWTDGNRTTVQADAAASTGQSSTFRFSIARVRESFRYRVQANDGLTREHRITAVERPAVENIDLHYEFPAYTGQQPRTETNAFGRIKAVRHTVVTLDVSINRDLDVSGSYLLFEPYDSSAHASHPVTQPDEADQSAGNDPAGGRRVGLVRIAPNRYRARMELLDNGRYDFVLRGGSLENVRLAPQSRPRVIVEPDEPPRVQIIVPAADEKIALGPDDCLSIGYEAGDDYGLARLALAYTTTAGKAWKQVPATMPHEASRRARATLPFDLAALGEDLSAVTELTCKLIVYDNRPQEFGGPQIGESLMRTIRLDPKQTPYADRLVKSLREQFADAVAEIIRQLKAAEADVGAVRKAMAAQPMLDAAQERSTTAALGRLIRANELALAAGTRMDFSQYQRMGERLIDVADAHIQPAHRLVDGSRELVNREHAAARADRLLQADFHIRRAIELLTSVGREFADLIKMERAAEVLAGLERKEQEIAVALEQEIRDPEQLARLAKEQAELLEQSRQLLRENPDRSAEPMYDVASKAVETLNEKIRQASRQQKDLLEETALAVKMQELDKRAGELAARQAELARTTAKFEAAQAEPLAKAEAPKPLDAAMDAAAKALERGDLKGAIEQQRQAGAKTEQAVAKLDEAIADLAGKSESRQLAQDRRASEQARALAEQARQLETRQKQIAEQTAQARVAADKATADKAAAEKARQALAEAAARQRAMVGEVAQFKTRLAQANEQTRKLAGEHNPDKLATEAANRLPAEPAEAAKPQQQAARQLGEMASKLDQLAKQAAERADQAQAAAKELVPVRQARPQAESIRQRQAQLAEQTRQLADDLAATRRELGDRQLADLRQRQADLAERATELADDVAGQPADEHGTAQPSKPDPTAAGAAAAARQAAEQLAENRLPQAGQQGRQAARQLQQLAKQLAQQSARQAGVNPQRQQQQAGQAGQAGRLAEQQQRINEQLANLQKEDPLANLPGRQAVAEQETRELGEQARMVADFMEQLAPAAGQSARQGASQLAERAPAAQGQAGEAMRGNQMPQARAAQQQAAAAMDRAEQLFRQAAQQAAATAGVAPPGQRQALDQPEGEPGEPGNADLPGPYDPLAEAAWAQGEAQAAIRQAAQAQAAQQSVEQQLAQARAAAAAAEAARQLGQAQQQMTQTVSMAAQANQPGQADQPSENYSPPWFSTSGTSGQPPDMRRLNFELGLTSSQWNRLPGYLKTAIIQASGENVPQEYRELVKRYFQTISQE